MFIITGNRITCEHGLNFGGEHSTVACSNCCRVAFACIARIAVMTVGILAAVLQWKMSTTLKAYSIQRYTIAQYILL